MSIDLYPTCLALRCSISALACIQLPELQVSFLLVEEFYHSWIISRFPYIVEFNYAEALSLGLVWIFVACRLHCYVAFSVFISVFLAQISDRGSVFTSTAVCHSVFDIKTKG